MAAGQETKEAILKQNPAAKVEIMGLDLSSMASESHCASGFSASSTAEQVTLGIDATGLTSIVTGGASGIGAETARVLALRGAYVIIGDKNMAAGQETKEAILKQNPAAKVEVMELDLSSMASVRSFVAQFKSTGLQLNLLINNAGVMGIPFALSVDNIELHFAINHVGHFLLTDLLLETMKNTAAESKKEGRIVNVSSVAHYCSNLEGHLDKINCGASYNSFLAYRVSKLATILHANELSRRLKAAATACYVALHPQVLGVSGKYFSDCNLSKPWAEATDIVLAKKLWDFTSSLIN
ncbi:hypothetical protein QQ045_004260 [Rhodiola kirilowii]